MIGHVLGGGIAVTFYIGIALFALVATVEWLRDRDLERRRQNARKTEFEAEMDARLGLGGEDWSWPKR